MQSSTIWTALVAILSPTAVAAIALAVPVIRVTVGKYVAGFLQHHFDERLEILKSDLQQSDERLRAELRASEQQLRTLTETTLSLRSSRQAALDARRLQAIEKIWAAKIATDRWKLAAQLTSILNLEEIFKAAENGDPRIEKFAETLNKLSGLDLEKEIPSMSAISERPFVSNDIWAPFSAYQGVMIHSVMTLKVLAFGATKYWKKEDALKPLMLATLPEYKDYIEQYGFSGYYHLLDVLEQKLLNAIAVTLDGQEVDAATLKRSAEIMSAARELGVETSRVPEDLRGPEIPPPTANSASEG